MVRIAGYLVVLVYLIAFASAAGPVAEYDDRIVEFSKQGKWLIMAYAPWCGHCKKLEPVYDEVGRHFINTDVTIAKIDATRFTKAASHFEIKGYPTIKFISNNEVFSFNGDRKLNAIVEFVDKANGPKVRILTSKPDFTHAKNKRKNFFLLVSSSEDESSLTKEYQQLANKYFMSSYFYITFNKDLLAKEIKIDKVPTIIAVKDEGFFYYDDTKSNLESFLRTEQFLTFTPLTISNFHSLIETQKALLILVSDEMNSGNELNKQIFNAMKSYSEKNRDKHSREFQLCHTDNTELLSSLAIWTLNTPTLFALNTSSYQYALIDIDAKQFLNDEILDKVLDDIREARIEFFGGDSYFRRFRRPLWEFYRAVIEMFTEAPIISTIIFGLPFGVISIVCYFLCCFEGSDQSEEELSDSEAELMAEDEANQMNGEINAENQIEEPHDETEETEDKKTK